MSETRALLTEIETAAAAMAIKPSTLCARAVNNGKLPDRLRNGDTITFATAVKLRAYIAEHAKPSTHEAA